MTQDKYTLAAKDEELFEHLVTLRNRLIDYILDLSTGRTDLEPSFANRLRQVLAAYNGELGRRLSGDPGSQKYLEHVAVNEQMGMLLASQHIERMKAGKVSGQRTTKEDRRVTRFLIAALDDLGTGVAELEERFGKIDLIDLPRKLWFTFCNIAADECRHDAASIREMFDRVREAA